MTQSIPDPIDRSVDPRWYKRAVFYEVLVRGFADSNGDGTGDLMGLTEKIDYLDAHQGCLYLYRDRAKFEAGIKKSNDAIQAALKAMASPAESVPADYESKTFGPMQKAYDSAMKALKS